MLIFQCTQGTRPSSLYLGPTRELGLHRLVQREIMHLVLSEPNTFLTLFILKVYGFRFRGALDVRCGEL